MNTKEFNIYIAHSDKTFLEHAEPLLNTCYSVSSSSDGKKILNDILQKQPDLTILDFNIPEIDVLKLCEKLSGDYPEAHIVICVNLDQLPIAKKKWGKRALDYIITPLHHEEFYEEVNKAVRYIFIERQREQLIRNKIELRYHLNNSLLNIKQMIQAAANSKDWTVVETIKKEIDELDRIIKDIEDIA